ncbi:hypothetical protein INR49_015340 [Caranx melampygus]|nr:hypothetical protein INR49_015340 [Caranx melampygus]
MARVVPVTSSFRSDGNPLQTPARPLEARAVPRRSTRGVPGPLILPGPALERGRPVRLLSVGHVARPQRTDLVFNPGPRDAACGQRGRFWGLLWSLLRVHGSLGLEVGAVLWVEHGVPQPRNKPLKGEAAMRWGDPPEAAQHSARQVLGVCALPATLNLRDVDVASSTIIQNVKQGPQAVSGPCTDTPPLSDPYFPFSAEDRPSNGCARGAGVQPLAAVCTSSPLIGPGLSRSDCQCPPVIDAHEATEQQKPTGCFAASESSTLVRPRFTMLSRCRR